MSEDVRNQNTQIPDTQIPDTQEDFENQSQRNAGEQTDSQTAWEVNRKRTYDAYQQPDLEGVRQNQRIFEQSAANLQANLAAINNITVQHLQNAVATSHKANVDAADNVVSTRASVLKVGDMAADGMWTDQMNPVTRGAGNDITGQAPVNAALASTASLDAVYMNLTAQNGELVTAIIGLANSVATQNTAVTAALAQLIQNAKQTSPTATA